MKTLVNILLALLCLGLFCGTGAATVRHVPAVYSTIQAAINASAVGDTVLVNEGTYKENITITKKITVGSLFIVDGDTAHISRTIIDGSQPSNPNFAAVVTIDGATDTTAVVAGFTLTGGKGNLRTVSYPGVSFQMIVGMGVDVAGGGARIHHNIVRANSCSAPSSYMGGVINIFDVADQYGISYVIVENNTIADNTLVGGDAEGGAFAIGHNSTIRDNVIARNAILGVSYPAIGAAFEIWNGHIKIERNLIVNNSTSHQGGALYAVAIPSMSLAPDIELVNNIIAENTAGTYGGGLFLSTTPATVLMVNNTLVSNVALGGGAGLAIQTGATVRALNTILWDSSASEVLTATGGSLIASYCDVAGGFAGTGNIDTNPGFVPGDALYHLDATSYCIGRGIESMQLGGVWCYAPAYDFDGLPRRAPTGPQHCDIGAQEEQITLDVPAGTTGLPMRFALEQNYPNPFNPKTVISCQWPVVSDVRLIVYDIIGREVAVLLNERKAPGRYDVEFDASGLSSGVYFYRLQAGSSVETKRLVLLK